MFACVCVYVCVYLYVSICVSVSVDVGVCVRLCVCLCLSVCVGSIYTVSVFTRKIVSIFNNISIDTSNIESK